MKQQLSEALEFRNLSPIIGSQIDSRSLHEEENAVLNDTKEVFPSDKQVCSSCDL
jgi:centromeric protein E